MARVFVAGPGDGVAETEWLTERIRGWSCIWQEYLPRDAAEEVGLAPRRHESTGRPPGGESFVRTVGNLVGRDLLRRKPGPKAKKQQSEPES